MTSETYHGWLLHQARTGDSSLRLSVLTQERGLMHCTYKGGLSPKKKSLAQPFQPLWLHGEVRAYGTWVNRLEVIKPQVSMTGDCLFSCLYLNEILYHALLADEPCGLLFDGYVETINIIASNPSPVELQASLRRFEDALLKHSGYGLSFHVEIDEEVSVEPGFNYQFIAGEGFIKAAAGYPGEHLLALSRNELTDVAVLKSAKFIMRQAIDHLLGGREIRTRTLFRGVIVK